jgi:hypothetical protein
VVVGIERQRELRTRRGRRKKVAKLTKKAEKANQSEKVLIAAKLRNLTPGAHIIIDRLGLEGRT